MSALLRPDSHTSLPGRCKRFRRLPLRFVIAELGQGLSAYDVSGTPSLGERVWLCRPRHREEQPEDSTYSCFLSGVLRVRPNRVLYTCAEGFPDGSAESGMNLET